jgi:P27 family predicted phage terminase small subunit
MRGPKPKPTALKRLAGNPGKRKLNDDDLKAPPGCPDCPADITGLARDEWIRITAELNALGMLTKCDRAALATYCGLYEQALNLKKIIKKKGLILKDGTNRPHPAVAMKLKTEALMKAYLIEFGLTPSSRARMKVPGQETKDPMDDFLRRSQPGPN